MTEESNLIVLKDTWNKTPGLKIKIQPCPDKMGKMPECVRKVGKDGDMILSEKDKIAMNSSGAVFIPENETITVQHGTTFNLNDPLQAAQWEAIKNAFLICSQRDAKDGNGNYIIDGGETIVDRYRNPKGRWGIAELYVERPGAISKTRNDMRKLILQAQNLVMNDSLDHRVLICKLFEKDYSHANSNDVEDFLFTQAEKYPEKVIKFYNSEESAIRLLAIRAKEKGILTVKQDGIYYADIKLGSSLDFAVEYLKNDKVIASEIKKETFPEMEKKVSPKK